MLPFAFHVSDPEGARTLDLRRDRLNEAECPNKENVPQLQGVIQVSKF